MSRVVVVGGINIDIEGRPFEKLKYRDSNPGKISISYGGVGRNIAENVSRLGGTVSMLSVIGDDEMGHLAVEDLANSGVNVDNVLTIPGRQSSMYLSILDDQNDMELGLSDMDIIENITPDFLLDRLETLNSASIIALDGNLSTDILEYAAGLVKDVPLFLDPVSAVKAVRAKKVIGRFHSVKPNLIEAEVLSGMNIASENDLKKVGQWFIDQGVERVYITMNKDGVYYKSRSKEGIVRPLPLEQNIESATGAGDSFSAMILQGTVQGMDIDEIAKMGIGAASITLESRQAVNKNINIGEVKRRMRKCTEII